MKLAHSATIGEGRVASMPEMLSERSLPLSAAISMAEWVSRTVMPPMPPLQPDISVAVGE